MSGIESSLVSRLTGHREICQKRVRDKVQNRQTVESTSDEASSRGSRLRVRAVDAHIQYTALTSLLHPHCLIETMMVETTDHYRCKRDLIGSKCQRSKHPLSACHVVVLKIADRAYRRDDLHCRHSISS